MRSAPGALWVLRCHGIAWPGEHRTGIGVINPRTSRNPAGKGCRLAPVPPLGPIAWGQYDADGDGLAPIGKYAVVLVCSDFPIAIFHHVIAELWSIAGQVRKTGSDALKATLDFKQWLGYSLMRFVRSYSVSSTHGSLVSASQRHDVIGCEAYHCLPSVTVRATSYSLTQWPISTNG